MRVVLDTNVLVSAFLGHGKTERVVSLWQDARFIPLVSKAMLEEYYRVLAYPKFKLNNYEIKNLVEDQFLFFAEPVKVRAVKPVIEKDPSDDIFLACALYGRAQYLVSGDQHLLTLKHYQKTDIISVGHFLAQF